MSGWLEFFSWPENSWQRSRRKQEVKTDTGADEPEHLANPQLTAHRSRQARRGTRRKGPARLRLQLDPKGKGDLHQPWSSISLQWGQESLVEEMGAQTPAFINAPSLYVGIHVKSLQSCPTLCNPMDCSPPGSSVHGILQARILESVAMPSSRGSPYPGIEPASTATPALQAGSLPQSHWGSPPLYISGAKWWV